MTYAKARAKMELSSVRLQEEGVLYCMGCSEGFPEEVALELGVAGWLGLRRHIE